MLQMPDGTLRHSSHVQLRGSVPLLWSQPPDVWPSPSARVVRDLEVQAASFRKFTTGMLQGHQVGEGEKERKRNANGELPNRRIMSQ